MNETALKEGGGVKMFSQLGPLFAATFRQAESTDTRQAIRHEEEKDGRRKQEFEERPDDRDLWQDSTTVSVEALRAFLMNFLRAMDVPEDDTAGTSDATVDMPSPASPPSSQEPGSTAAARASRAYRSMAEKTGAGTVPPPPPAAAASALALADAVTKKEVRTMHKLIADLDVLSRTGIRELRIQKADSFLDSLVQAVKEAGEGR